MKPLYLLIGILTLSAMTSACSKSNEGNSNGQYWNVVMAGNSTASITFGQPLSSTGLGILSGGSTGVYSASNYNLYIAGGGTACNMVNTPGQVIVPPGGQSGTINFGNNCTGNMTADLVVTLGNASNPITDKNGQNVVGAGQPVTRTIAKPGAAGSSTGNINY